MQRAVRDYVRFLTTPKTNLIDEMKYSALASTVIGLGICLSGAAHAFDINVNVGAPAPVVVAPPVVIIGWHGDRYYDGRRYWERREWEARQYRREDRDDDYRRGERHGRGHCPPGHAMKGEC